ncbi:hypothetical protein KBH77_03840, partial [Patescibacteria group bacterium]|nr:hypothetical protein [Patescibacteria group bacterium]
FSVPRNETSTKVRSCNYNKMMVLKPYYFGRLHYFGVFFNKIKSEKGTCCLDFYGNEDAKQELENMFSQLKDPLTFCCSNFWEHSLSYIFAADILYDKQNPQHTVYIDTSLNLGPYFDFLRKGIVEYPNGSYDTMIKDFLENTSLLHTDSHKFIAFMYMWYRGVVMGAKDGNLILMTTDYFNDNF